LGAPEALRAFDFRAFSDHGDLEQARLDVPEALETPAADYEFVNEVGLNGGGGLEIADVVGDQFLKLVGIFGRQDHRLACESMTEAVLWNGIVSDIAVYQSAGVSDQQTL
jgi:hypothetical protein